MTLSPTLALVWTLTTLAAALMILAATWTSTVVQRRPRRCPACGRLASQGRCRCTAL